MKQFRKEHLSMIFRPFSLAGTSSLLALVVALFGISAQPGEAFEPKEEDSSSIVWEVQEGNQTWLDDYLLLLTEDGDPLLAMATEEIVVDDMAIPEGALLIVISVIAEDETNVSPSLRGTAQVLYSQDGDVDSAEEYFVSLSSIQYIDLGMRPVYPAQ